LLRTEVRLPVFLSCRSPICRAISYVTIKPANKPKCMSGEILLALYVS
jgi:hypothetical protein